MRREVGPLIPPNRHSRICGATINTSSFVSKPEDAVALTVTAHSIRTRDPGKTNKAAAHLQSTTQRIQTAPEATFVLGLCFLDEVIRAEEILPEQTKPTPSLLSSKRNSLALLLIHCLEKWPTQDQ